MLETLLKLYSTAMTFDVRSPTPHLVGPPGCGKSTFAQQLADLLGKELHVINVSRISPLELEGIQMPVDNNSRLELLTARYWTRLKEGDIVLFDEFLRGFPEVYNGLLDIFTSRQVGGYQLPKVFVMAASNSVTTYDKALEDRLIHILVPDPRTNKSERTRLGKLLTDHIGLHPKMANSPEMRSVLEEEILPMYELLDQFQNKGKVVSAQPHGLSPRNLIGQARLRLVQSRTLQELITANNQFAISDNSCQYVVLMTGKNVPPKFVNQAAQLKGSDRLTDLQKKNLQINLQLIELEEATLPPEVPDHDDDPF